MEIGTDEAAVPPTVASILGLLGEGAAGPILVALRPRPLRTKQLTKKVAPFGVRTIYRRVARMTELGLVDRQEEVGVPSTVVHRLSDPSGRELFRLLNRYAPPIMGRGPDGRIDQSSWTFFALLGEMWSSGWIERFSDESQAPTELAEATPGWTFHQVNRRLRLLVSMDLLSECARQGRGRHYQLTDEARRGAALIAAIGRWRGRHASVGAGQGLLVQELAIVVRACIPLTSLPYHADMSLRLGLAGATDQSGGRGSTSVLAQVGRKGAFRCAGGDADATADGWAIGTVDTWYAAILDDKRGRMRVGGNLPLVDASLKQLYATLWNGPVACGLGGIQGNSDYQRNT